MNVCLFVYRGFVAVFNTPCVGRKLLSKRLGRLGEFTLCGKV